MKVYKPLRIEVCGTELVTKSDYNFYLTKKYEIGSGTYTVLGKDYDFIFNSTRLNCPIYQYWLFDDYQNQYTGSEIKIVGKDI